MNFKEKRNKGVVALLSVAIVMLLIGGGFYYLTQQQNVNPETAYNQSASERYDDRNPMSGTTNKYIEVVDAVKIEALDAGKNKSVYLVALEDNKQALLEIDKNDEATKQLDDREKLQQTPTYLRVKVVKGDDDYPAVARNVNKEAKVQVNTTYFLSASEAKSDTQKLTWVSLGIVAFGLVLIGAAVWKRNVNTKGYDKLYALYPELQQDFTKLAEGQYVDERLRSVIYKDHMISLHKGIQVIELDDIQKIRPYTLVIRQGLVTNRQYFIQLELHSRNKPLNVPVPGRKKETELYIQEFVDAVIEAVNGDQSVSTLTEETPTEETSAE